VVVLGDLRCTQVEAKTSHESIQESKIEGIGPIKQRTFFLFNFYCRELGHWLERGWKNETGFSLFVLFRMMEEIIACLYADRKMIQREEHGEQITQKKAWRQ
jgi:hypothetical protein